MNLSSGCTTEITLFGFHTHGTQTWSSIRNKTYVGQTSYPFAYLYILDAELP